MKRRTPSKAELVARMVNAQSWNGRVDEDEKRDLLLFAWMSFDWAKRSPSERAVMNILCICNLSLVLANKGYPKAYAGECNESFAVALARLKHLIERGDKTGSWALDGELIRHVPIVMALYEEQLSEVSRKVMESCVNFVRSHL